MQDLTVIENLCVVVVRSFEATPEDELAYPVDPPGSVNYFCDLYGMAKDKAVPPGILWADYDCGDDSPWDFAVLIAEDELDAVRDAAVKAGYKIIKVSAVTEPAYFGDGNNGIVAILKHPDGWVVVS